MGDELTDREFERYELEEETLEDDALCTCDIDGEDSCPIHYPIDDGGDDDDCMECGLCDSCIERTKEFYEYMENENERPNAEPVQTEADHHLETKEGGPGANQVR